MAEFKIGDRVECDKGGGVVAYFGEASFSDGLWVGIILDEPNGKNNGNVQGVQYFTCETNHGTFVRPVKVRLEGTGSQASSSHASMQSNEPKRSGRQSGIQSPARQTSNLKASAIPSKSGIKSPARQTSNLKAAAVSETKSPARQDSNLKAAAISETKSSARQDSNLKASAIPSKLPARQTSNLRASALPKASVSSTPQATPNQPKSTHLPTPQPHQTPKASDTIHRQQSTEAQSPAYKPKESFFIGDPNVDNSNQTVKALQDEITDLNNKLDSLRAKRKEDAAKIAELDRLKIQYQHLLEFKIAITDEQNTLRQQLEDTRRQLAQSEANAREMRAAMNNDLTEQLEMITLDKLVAEERAEVLLAEVDEQRHQIMNLEGELAVRRNMNIEGGDGGNEEIAQQIENYKTALTRMRDIVTTANAERQEAQQQLDQCRNDCDRLQLENDRLITECGKNCDELGSLNEQLDAALGSTKMVEYLTEKNLDLEDRIRALTDENDRLDEMIQLSEEIAEAAREGQAELRRECDGYIVELSDKYNELLALENQIVQYENMMQKFRQQTADLNNEIVDYKDKIQLLEQQLSEQSASGSAAVTAMFTSNRNFAEHVNSELYELEAKYLQEQINHLRNFLPAIFAKPGGDFDCVLLIVFFPRISAKSELLLRLLDERFADVPGDLKREHVIKSYKAEQLAHVRKFNYYLRALISVANRFETMTQYCTVERLTSLALQRTEITNQERNVDQYFELLKGNQFDVNTSVDILKRSSVLLERIFSVNADTDGYNTRTALIDYLHQFTSGIRWIRFNCARLKFFMLPTEFDDTINELTEHFNEIDSVAKRADTSLLRAQKWISSDKMIDLSHDMIELLATGFSLVEKVASILHDTNSLAVSRLAANAPKRRESFPDVEGFSTNELKELLQSVVEKREGHKTPDEAIDEVRSSMDALCSCVEDIGTKLEKRQLERPIPPARNDPLKEHSQKIKEMEVETENLLWQVSKKDKDIARLAKALKDAEDTVCVLKIHLEREKKKADEVERGESKSAHDDEHANELLSAERQKHQQELKDLHSKLDVMEKQLLEKDAQVKRAATKAAFLDPAGLVTGGDRNGMEVKTEGNIPQISGFQQTPAEMLQSLHWAQERARRLQAELDARQLSALRPLNLSFENVCGTETMRLRNHVPVSAESIENQYRLLVDESNRLQLDRKNLTTVPENKLTNESYRRQVVEFNNRAIDLRSRVRAFVSRNFPHIPLPKQECTEIVADAPDRKKAMNSAEFQALFKEKLAARQKHAQSRKELISSMLRDIKNKPSV